MTDNSPINNTEVADILSTALGKKMLYGATFDPKTGTYKPNDPLHPKSGEVWDIYPGKPK